jgi:iron complex transport system substrate-binding protein
MVKLKLAIALLAVALLAALVPAAASPANGKPKPKLFPVRVQAANGAVTITKRPMRIVSLSPSATETLFAIGAGKQVVAVDSLSNYPAGAPKTDLSAFKPNAEAIAAYKPDLVVAGYDTGIVAALNKLGIKVVLEPAATSLPQAYDGIRDLGAATGFPKKAAALVARMQKTIKSAVASAAGGGKGLSLYHELSPDYYSATSKTFIGQIYKLFGLANIADAAATATSDYPQLSAEYVISSNPKLIFLGDAKCCAQNAATVAARPGWTNVDAVRNGGVIALDDDVVARWGPRIALFVQQVAAAVRKANG